MEDVGRIIVDLHGELRQIRDAIAVANQAGDRREKQELLQLQATLEQAEAELQRKAAKVIEHVVSNETHDDVSAPRSLGYPHPPSKPSAQGPPGVANRGLGYATFSSSRRGRHGSSAKEMRASARVGNRLPKLGKTDTTGENLDLKTVMHHKPARLHEYTQQFTKTDVSVNPKPLLKLDIVNMPTRRIVGTPATEQVSQALALVPTPPEDTFEAPPALAETSRAEPPQDDHDSFFLTGVDDPGQSMAHSDAFISDHRPLESQASLEFPGQPDQVVIADGSLPPISAYRSLKQKHRRIWTAVSTALRRIEDICRRSEVPVCVVDGAALAALITAAPRVAPSDASLMSCIVNREDVENFVKVPGSRFLGTAREEAAATYIAATRRMVLQQREMARRKRAAEAASVIQQGWRSQQLLARTKAQVQQVMEGRSKILKELMFKFGTDYRQRAVHRRVEVHVHSISIPERRRPGMDSFMLRQNAQAGRIFRVMDPKVDVVYIAPEFFHEELLDYYNKIMAFRGVRNPGGRFQVVVPENMGLHSNFSLSSALLASPKALKRVKKLVRGRNAFLVPSLCGPAEEQLAGELEVPLFGPEIRNLPVLGTKSGTQKVIRMAGLPAPPFASEVYDEEDFYTQLAELLVGYPEVRVWVIKIDDEHGSRGHAYIDMHRLKVVADVRGQMAHLSQTDAGAGTVEQELKAIRGVLIKDLHRRVEIVNKGAYPDWKEYLAEFLKAGGIIQAAPPGIVSHPSIHLRIDPDGAVSVVGTSEAVFAKPFLKTSSFVPHITGPPEALNKVGMSIGRALAAKGMIGFATVDLVLFENPTFEGGAPGGEDGVTNATTPALIGGTPYPDDAPGMLFSGLRSPSPAMTEPGFTGRNFYPEVPPSRMDQYHQMVEASAKPPPAVELQLDPSVPGGVSSASRLALWVVDVDVRMTDEVAALPSMQLAAQLKFDAVSHTLQLINPPEDLAAEEGVAETPGQRYALLSHTFTVAGWNKSNYASVFQTCKQKGISFDLFLNVGTLFVHMDVFHSLAAVCTVAGSPKQCVQKMGAALQYLAEADKGGPAEPSESLVVRDIQTALRQWSKRVAKAEADTKAPVVGAVAQANFAA
mmetsp:Transcript_93916/g.251355  ORF Transcript_93916/g.251355 Transcript_93916/m.251355 type:complete len:1102 (-) Transcript_93916:179-3484(-)